MATMRVFAGEETVPRGYSNACKNQMHQSISSLFAWLERNDYKAYDTFGGLSATFLRPLTFEKKFLRQVPLHGVRQFLLNTRPLLGIKKSRSTKGWIYSGHRAWEHSVERFLAAYEKAFSKVRGSHVLHAIGPDVDGNY